MHLLFNYFIRFILIFIISLFYLKYRNNQCIKNQNCKPYFISNFLSFRKDFGFYIPITYELDDNIPNIDLSIESSPKIEDSPRYKNLPKDQLEYYINLVSYLKNRGYADVDFVNNKSSSNLPNNSYLPGTVSRNLNEILPSYVANSLQGAMKAFGKKMNGYFSNEAILLATESRTSSPVRIPRNKETFEHIQIKGLYPCAEGAGYAGGIVSAAMDGENFAKAIGNSFG